MAKKPAKPAPRRRAPSRRPAKKSPPKRARPKPSELAPIQRPPPGKAFPIEIDPARIEATLAKVGEEVSHWAKKGRYTKVRFKFRGRQLLPDLPLAAVVAAEGLTFYWGGLLRALLMNLGANAVFGVELVNDSEKKIALGKERLLQGDVEAALALFDEAADMDRDNPRAHLNRGIARKLKGDRAGARAALERARVLDAQGPVGAEAERILTSLPSEAVVTVVESRSSPA